MGLRNGVVCQSKRPTRVTQGEHRHLIRPLKTVRVIANISY